MERRSLEHYDKSGQDFDTIHEAALDAFVKSQHGRNLYTLHYEAGVSIADDVDDITRIERLTILKLGEHYSESEGGTPTNTPSNIPNRL